MTDQPPTRDSQQRMVRSRSNYDPAPVADEAGSGGSGRRHLDLFSGIGGFAIAAQACGFETVAFSEIEPYATAILKRHWPDVPNLGDIRNVRGVRADLVTGGFPCQPFSLAGKQRGAEDHRHLWPEMLRVIEDARPTWVVGENVPGIIGMELDGVLSDLESLGYAAWPLGIPACAVDARHRRQRIWIVAYSESCGRGQGSALTGGSREGTGEARERSGLANGGSHVADAASEQAGGLQQRPIPADACNGRHGPAEAATWATEPAVGRVANGIPARAHRLRGLGNAIVPQVAQRILSGIAALSFGRRGCGAVGDENRGTNEGKAPNCDSQTSGSHIEPTAKAKA